MNSTSTLIFIIAAFALGAVTILKRESMTPAMRRGMAIVSIVFIAFAFFLIVYAFFTMGTQ